MATRLYKTVKPTGGDYISVQACLDANEKDLVTADQYFDIEIDGTWISHDSAILISGAYITDATHYIHIYTTLSARGDYIAEGTTERCLEFGTSAVWYVRIEGITFLHQTSDDIQLVYMPDSMTGEVWINCCKIINRGGGSSSYNIQQLAADLKIWNSISIQDGNADVDVSNFWLQGGTTEIYNTIISGGRYSIASAGATIVAKNVYAFANYKGYDTPISMITCASYDNSGSVGLQNIAKNTTQFVNVTDGSEDFHLAGTGSALYHAGTNTSGDPAPLNFTTDFDGIAYADPRSIGAYEYGQIAESIGLELSFNF